MLLMCLVKAVWRAQTCAHRHSQNTHRITQGYLQAQGIEAHTQPCLARWSANLREESWTRFVVLQLSLVRLSVSYFALCSIAAWKKGCLQTCQAAGSQLTSLQNLTLPHLTRLSYAKQLCQRRILVDPAFLSADLRNIPLKASNIYET